MASAFEEELRELLDRYNIELRLGLMITLNGQDTDVSRLENSRLSFVHEVIDGEIRVPIRINGGERIKELRE